MPGQVEQRHGLPFAGQQFHPDAKLAQIGEGVFLLMAVGAGLGTVFRQHFFVKQHPAEFDPFVGEDIVRRNAGVRKIAELQDIRRRIVHGGIIRFVVGGAGYEKQAGSGKGRRSLFS